MIQKFLDTRVSIATLVGWAVAVIGLVFSIASAYGEQQQKLLYLTERQSRIELSIERIEALQQQQAQILTEIRTELKRR
jgi:Tfp pilus assembly protein PilN